MHSATEDVTPVLGQTTFGNRAPPMLMGSPWGVFQSERLDPQMVQNQYAGAGSSTAWRRGFMRGVAASWVHKLELQCASAADCAIDERICVPEGVELIMSGAPNPAAPQRAAQTDDTNVWAAKLELKLSTPVEWLRWAAYAKLPTTANQSRTFLGNLTGISSMMPHRDWEFGMREIVSGGRSATSSRGRTGSSRMS